MIDEKTRQNDPIAVALRTYAQNILVVIFGLLPLFFVPSIVAPFDYSKVLIVLIGVFVALVLYSLSVLRTGVVQVGVSFTLIALWGIALIALISSLLSGDFKDSFVGDFFSIHATMFVAVLALVPTVWVILKASKASVMRMYMLFTISTLVLVVYHILRLVFGAEFFPFHVFTSNVSSPVGSWNDLALFLGLSIILSLVALEQLMLSRMGKTLFFVVTLVSLFMLGVINFFTVWIVLGITSLVVVVYTLGRGRFSETQLSPMSTQNANTTSLAVSLIVFAVSVLFVVGGSTFGGLISKYTGVTYVEVRPSLEATANIARNVYHENAFLGIGTNKFTDAWRLYKEDSINLTAFWNTDFNAGNGYVTTFFVTNGVLGGLAWLIFLGIFVVTGVRRLMSPTNGDKAWYFIAVSSFVSAVYIWGMSLIYVPGVVILLLGSLCTGIALGALNELHVQQERLFSIGMNRRTGFVLTLVVITVIIGSVSVLYVTGRHYASVYTFNESVLAMQQGKAVDELEKQVQNAYQLSVSDVFARRIAEYQLTRMNQLIALKDPTPQDQQEFQQASVVGVNAAQQAIQLDGQEPANWEVLGSIYGVLSSVHVEGAQERALEALTKSRILNPKNPLPYLESAIVEARGGKLDDARTNIQKAITLKSNYTDAFFLLSQLEIASGNVEAAVKSTQATISLDPQNPARYYQLGVLESARNNVPDAIGAFERAVALDQNYANARYLLALAYDASGRSDEAKKQLEAVLNLNPGNADITTLIKTIEQDGSLKKLHPEATKTVNEATPKTNDNGTVSTSGDTKSPLVTPVNTAPKVEKASTTQSH